MKHFVILAVACAAVLAAPEGPTEKDTASAATEIKRNDYQPSADNGLPCNHAPYYSDLVQSQSTGRIVNQQQNLATSASGINSQQAQAVTLTGQIVVGDSGSTSAQEFHTSQASAQRPPITLQPLILPVQQSQTNTLPQLPSVLPPPPFNPAYLTPGKGVPSQVLSGEIPGYVHNKGVFTSQGSLHAHYQPRPGAALINGFGKVPPPLQPSFNGLPVGVQYTPGFVNNNNIDHSKGIQGAAVHGSNTFNVPPPSYRPSGPVVSGSTSQFGAGSFEQSAASNAFAAVSSLPAGPHFLPPQSAHPAGSTINGANAFFGAPLSAGHALNGPLGHVIRQTVANAPLDPTIEKHIYVHVPPEDLEGNSAATQPAVFYQPRPRKHYKIIFIKAPSEPQPSYAQLASSAAAPQTEEKTLVYVLVKKPDEPSLQEIQQLQQQYASNKPDKPEVYFIKYKPRREGDVPTQVYPSSTYGGVASAYNAATSVSTSGNPGVEAGSGIDVKLVGSESNAIRSASSSSYSASVSSSSLSSSSGGGFLAQNHESNGVPLE